MSDARSRYVRQSQFAPIGDEGQANIERSRVAVLGCGALGSVAAELLTRAGVGMIRLIDRDLVEWSNLQRQSLYVEHDAETAAAKAEAAATQLRRINSTIEIEEKVADVTADNITPLLNGVDLVIDATDNFAIRLLLNDWSIKHAVPWVHGGCVGAMGQVRLFSGHPPCFRCLVPELPGPGQVQTCDTAGVIGPATHLIASLQSAEALKWLSGNREAVNDQVIWMDLWRNQTRAIGLRPATDPPCVACGQRVFDFLDSADTSATVAETLCGRDAVQITGPKKEIDFDRVSGAWKSSGSIQNSRFFIRLTLPENQTLTLFRDGRAVISGVRDIPHARSIYDRYVGS